jgi:hypothetical protein
MSRSETSSLAQDFLLLSVVAGMVGGILAYIWFGVHAGPPGLVPHGVETSSLAPAMAVAEAGIGIGGLLWNLFVFVAAAGLTAGAVGIAGLVTLRRKR